MIERYTRAPLGAIWGEENRFRTWLEVELALLKVLGQKGIVPRNTAGQIRAAAKIDVNRMLELERTVKHDVIAFTTSIAEQVGKPGRFFHYGLTSSDVVDTALSMLLKQALEAIAVELDSVMEALSGLAQKYRNLPAIGRTHGVHAEPTSFGLKFLGWLTEFRRQRLRLEEATRNISFGKISGAVGAYGVLTPEIEKKTLELLGLKAEPVATQVVPRDRHAAVFCTLAELGASIERVATELRHLQRTEVSEVEEGFSRGQKGSSAMPHKKNPISAENLTGCARLLRGYAVSALENVALWHERDISHSAVERIIGPDATILTHYMLQRLGELLGGLRVLRPNVEKNLARTQGIYFSGRVLLRLVEKGMSREEAYALVQRCAHTAWDQNRWFGDELAAEPGISGVLSRKEIDAILDVKNYLRHVDTMYARVLGADSPRRGRKNATRKKTSKASKKRSS